MLMLFDTFKRNSKLQNWQASQKNWVRAQFRIGIVALREDCSPELESAPPSSLLLLIQ